MDPAVTTMTSAPDSSADAAVHKPDIPDPITTTSAVMVSTISSSLTGSGGTSNDHVLSSTSAVSVSLAAESCAAEAVPFDVGAQPTNPAPPAASASIPAPVTNERLDNPVPVLLFLDMFPPFMRCECFDTPSVEYLIRW